VPRDPADSSLLDLVGLRDFAIVETTGGTEVTLDLVVLAEAAIGLAGLDGFQLVLSPQSGGAAISARLLVGGHARLTLDDISLVLRFPTDWFKPMQATGGTFVEKRAPDGSPLPYEISLTGIALSLDLGHNVEVAAAPGAPDLFADPFMIGDTGIVVEAQGIALCFSDEAAVAQGLNAHARGVHVTSAAVHLPQELAGLLPDDVALEEFFIGAGGFSGRVRGDWTPSLNSDGTDFQGAGAGRILDLPFGLEHVAIDFEQNLPTAFDLEGRLLVPFFREAVGARINLAERGDFSITLATDDPDGIVLTSDELLALAVRSLSVTREGDLGLVSVSGALQPLVMASDGLEWPSLDVVDLQIDTQGRFRIREAWLDLKELATLDLFGFHFELARIGLGYEEPREGADAGRLWVDLSGSLRLIEQLPVGLGVEGFRLSWPENLDELLALDGPPTTDQALAILGQLQVQFEGVQLFFGVPDAVEFEGLIRFFKEAQAVGFVGDAALRVPASGFALEAGLLIGMNFEPPPFPFLYVSFGVELPVGIPLGQSGLALKGAKGLFGLNVSPAKAPEANWFYDWYKGPPEGAHPAAKWQNQRSALAFGAGLTVTTADGYVKGMRGLLVLSLPGPILIIEGRALILDFLGGGDPPFAALAVFDGIQRTVQFNIEAQAELVEDVLEAHGGLEAFFDFNDLTNWHLYLGQDEPEERRVQANILKLPGSERYLFEADGYLMLDMVGSATVRSRLGMSVGFRERFDEFDPFVVDLDASVEGDGSVTIFPEQFSGDVELGARLDVSAFDIGVQLSADAALASEGPEPFRVEATLDVSADLPFPLPPLEMEYTFRWEAPPSPKPVSPLVGVVVDSDLAPGGGGLELFESADRLPEVDPDPARPAARTAAADSPTVPLDGRPTLLFGHDMNDGTSGVFARDIERDTHSYRVGRLELTPVLQEIGLYEHRKSDPWTGDFAADWQLAASSAPASGLDPLWGVWLADAAPEDPSAPIARRLRLWTANPFVHARALVGTGYSRIFGLAGPRMSYADEFVRDYPDYFECRRLEPKETCVDFVDAAAPPKEATPAPVWTHGSITFTGVATLLDDGSGNPCLQVRGGLLLRFPVPVVRARVLFCVDPGLSVDAARGRTEARRVPTGQRDAACSEPVEVGIAVDGAAWTIEADEAFDCLEIMRPAPIGVICFLPMKEAARAERAAEQCAVNDEVITRLGEAPPVLRAGSFYRLLVKTSVGAALVPAPADSPIASILDGLYTAALDALGGEEPRGFLHEAFFQTEAPPRSLAPYVKWSSPESQATRVFREDDLVVRFRRSYVEELYSQAPHRLTLAVRDAQGRTVPGYEIAWSRAETATLLSDERSWRNHLDDPPPAPRDDVVSARRRLALAEDFDDARLTGWKEMASEPLTGVKWRAVNGELQGAGRAFAGSSAFADFAKPGPLLVFERAMPTSFTFSVELRSDTGEATGVVFCLADPRTFYRFSMDDRLGYRRVVKVRNGFASLLHETREGFERGMLHELEVIVTPVGDATSIALSLDGRLWAKVVDRLEPLREGRIGFYCWKTDAARFARVRVRHADVVEPVLAPRQRYELVVLNPADDAFVPYRVPFVTSAFARFRDLVLSFSGEAARMPCAPLGRPQVAAIATAAERYVAARKAWTEGRVLFRDQALDRAGLEARKLALREPRAALDEAFRALADQAGIPWLTPVPSALTVITLALAEAPSNGSVAGFWLRSPEPFELRYGSADAHVGRTVIELAQRRTGGEWKRVPSVQLASADGTEVFLVPTVVASGDDGHTLSVWRWLMNVLGRFRSSESSSAWPTGQYRLIFTYHRNLGASSQDDRSDLPVEHRLGSDAPERVSVDWAV
jgi:hypothetical protein